MWTILAILAVLSLGVFWRGPNATWGGVLVGAAGGLIFASVAALRGQAFIWVTIAKGAVAGVLVGAAADLLGKWSAQRRAKG